MVEIIPSILTDNPEELRELISLCEGVVQRVSIDIIDGKFADNKTIDPSILFDIDTTLKVDYQLMVVEPVNWVERCVRGQADRIIGHIEHMTNQLEFVGKVQEVGAMVGLALDLDTPVDKLDPTILNNLDVVLVMSVAAGFGGQNFDDRVLDKIKKLDEIRVRDNTPFKIQDDGGITLDKIDDVRLGGVDEVSIGRRLFESDLRSNIEKFTKAAYKEISF
ncbi:MAG: Ribulose-phosphate 3-epimerase [Microgenomates group bacterium GW2011_GWC1_37_8]|uniref:Ribulose-phosphate 3-epimerase n=1 Tax=Candidatus Woesebacteria bacterium GW2011_GWB1_38_8 TaxID=1618570 RepID=A0A0G0L068_9BACT|nr:MAG: Ribulose-phosphate 3-epimerase [Microgenomates group bacterium GW2011_GWC1_37_8]KKQ84402.1 MAG: Ribulose-phosphate 3-epimerase [Candidatus Woesebacteria bacterium GW2011_GWB1_38_8]